MKTKVYYEELEKRFWSHVAIGDEDECWEWQGAVNVRHKYGLFWDGENTIHAHRFSWKIANGPLPRFVGGRQVVVRHLCSNRVCVNSSHLEIGTLTDNTRDMHREGIGVKFNRHQAEAIRYMREDGETYACIAKHFDTSPGTITRVIKRIGIYSEI